MRFFRKKCTITFLHEVCGEDDDVNDSRVRDLQNCRKNRLFLLVLQFSQESKSGIIISNHWNMFLTLWFRAFKFDIFYTSNRLSVEKKVIL